MLKPFIFGALSALALISASHAATYECNTREYGKFTFTLADDQKSLTFTAEQYGDACKGTEKAYKATNDKYKNAKLYSFDGNPMTEDGSSELVVSKEILAGAKFGFAQYRNYWDTYTSFDLPCSKQK